MCLADIERMLSEGGCYMFSCYVKAGGADNPNLYLLYSWWKFNKHRKSKRTPLQAHIINSSSAFNSGRRIYKTSPLGDSGSITVEASIVLPLFIFVMLALYSVGGCILVKNTIYEGFCETAEYLAEYANLGWQLKQSDSLEAVEHSAETEINTVLANTKIREYTDDRSLVERYVSGGMTGVVVTRAALASDNYIYLKLSYDLVIRIPVIGEFHIPCSEQIRQMAYLGYDKNADDDRKGTYVYMAENGVVYHCSRNCSYIKLSIRQVDASYIKDDKTGLSPCRLCRKYMSTGILYVTSQGDRYHCSLNCSGLKRTVYRVMKEEHPELRPCSKCGK